MKEFTIIKLKNLSPFHLGTGKEAYDFASHTLHSDTISAALASVRAELGRKRDVLEFLNSFSISAAFPFYKSSLFFPKVPGDRVIVNGVDSMSYRKKLKKIRFIEYPVWTELIGGKPCQIDANQIRGEFLFHSQTGLATLYKSQVNQRVSVPRADGMDSEPFYFEWTFFNSEAGFFCLIDAEDSLLAELKELFVELGRKGLGTDKSIGGGKFEIEIFADKISVPEPNDANHTFLLSMYIPEKEELNNLGLANSKYELVHRGGFIAGSDSAGFQHLRKRSVYMFSYGSVFPTTSRLSGKIVNLRPDWNDNRLHPVYRSGKPLCIHVKI